MDIKKVSIIVTTYKRPQFIRECVESLINQTYPNYEIIIVDDNGIGTKEQEETANILDFYIEQYNVHYIAHEVNRNGSAARNTGIRRSSGDYICFIDDDDIFLPEKLECQIEFLNNHGEEFGGCSTGFHRFYENGEFVEFLPKDGKDVAFEILNRSTSYCFGSTLLIRRDVIDSIGLFDEGFERQQDLEYVLRICSTFKIGVVEKVLSKIRIHENFRNLRAEDIRKANMTLLIVFKDRIDELAREKRKQIYFNNYLTIAKQYAKEYRLLKVLKYWKLSGKPIKFVVMFLRDMKKYKEQTHLTKEKS